MKGALAGEDQQSLETIVARARGGCREAFLGLLTAPVAWSQQAEELVSEIYQMKWRNVDALALLCVACSRPDCD